MQVFDGGSDEYSATVLERRKQSVHMKIALSNLLARSEPAVSVDAVGAPTGLAIPHGAC